jgi:hypothetical protein
VLVFDVVVEEVVPVLFVPVVPVSDCAPVACVPELLVVVEVEDVVEDLGLGGVVTWTVVEGGVVGCTLVSSVHPARPSRPSTMPMPRRFNLFLMTVSP